MEAYTREQEEDKSQSLGGWMKWICPINEKIKHPPSFKKQKDRKRIVFNIVLKCSIWWSLKAITICYLTIHVLSCGLLINQGCNYIGYDKVSLWSRSNSCRGDNWRLNVMLRNARFFFFLFFLIYAYKVFLTKFHCII